MKTLLLLPLLLPLVAISLLTTDAAGVAPVLDEGDHLAVPRRAQHDGLAPLAAKSSNARSGRPAPSSRPSPG